MNNPLPGSADELRRRDIYTVSRLNREARMVLEGSFPLIWIEGEISNLARPGSGHLYFTLKDAGAQVRCAMFRNRNQYLRFKPIDGMQVLMRVKVGLYEGRGEYQLVAEHMEEAGDGALRRAFEELKQKLAQEGLFDGQYKQAFPELPHQVGVITSPTGAAIRDILTVLERRFPALPVLLYPVPVQGEGAAEKIARAIETANEHDVCDVLIVARGGGSLEDLQSFNEEIVARAIFASRIPIVCGVGHEVDFTIADLVADQRAPTPSAAAEFVSPDQGEWQDYLIQLASRLRQQLHTRTAQLHERLRWLQQRLQQQHPGSRLNQHAQRLDELEQRLLRAQRQQQQNKQHRLEQCYARLQQHTPIHVVERLNSRYQNLRLRLQSSISTRLDHYRQRLAVPARALDAVSPLATLERGYAIVTRPRDHTVIMDAASVEVGAQVEARLHKGTLLCSVDKVIRSRR